MESIDEMGEAEPTTVEKRETGPAESVLNAPWLLPLIAVVLIAGAYARAPLLGLVFDDDIIVKANPYITSVRYIPSYFTEHIWSNLMLARKNYYRPVFLLWLLGNYLEFGTDPLGWHVSNLLLHLGNAVLMYLLALRFAGKRFAALAATLFFGLHPIQVENVAWASASTELLGALLAMAALLCYLVSLESAERRVLILSASVFLYALAVLTKETAIIVPAIIFLHEWFGRPASASPSSSPSRGQTSLAAFRESLPFGLVALAYLAARIAVLGGLGHTLVTMTKRVWLQTIPGMLEIYFFKVVWPVNLSAFYDYPYITVFSWHTVLLPLAVVVCLVVLLVLLVRKSPAAKLAAIWMALPILPVLDIPVFPRGEFLHDRYLYHPLIGASLLIGIGIATIERRWPARGVRTALYAGCAVVAATLGVATFRQTAYWTDNFTLYSRGVAVAPHSGFANNNLGAVLLNRGQWSEAMAKFQEAIDYAPNLYLAHYDLGLGYYQVERYTEAEACFKRAIAILPEDAESNLFLGMTYYHTNRIPEAMEYVRKAIALKPNGVGYHFALGVMLKDKGDLAGARVELLEELKRDPENQPTLEQLRSLDKDAGNPPAKQ